MKKEKRVLIIILDILLAIASIYMIYIIMRAARWTYFNADDFDHANKLGIFRAGIVEHFVASLRETVDYYFTWQGTYFSMFCQTFFSPLNGYGLIQLQIFMVGNVVLFFGGLFAFVAAIFRTILKRTEWHYILATYAILVFSFLAYKAWYEVFYWYSGAISFSVPLSFTFFSFAALAWANQVENKKRIILTVLSSVSAFFAVGGSLEVAGITCYILLGYLAFDALNTRTINIINVIVFNVSLVGALINVLAPGNYIRNGSTDLPWIQSILDMFHVVKVHGEWIFNATSFYGMMLLALGIGVILGKKHIADTKNTVLYMIYSLGAPYITVFPVVMAYGRTYFPNRCEFVLHIIMDITLLGLAFSVGMLMNHYIEDEKRRYEFAVIAAMMFLAVFSGNENFNYDDLLFVRTQEALENGLIENYSNRCMGIYEYIENSREKDIVITSCPIPLEYYSKLSLMDDSTMWMNQSVAEYYGKSSVVVVWE